MPKAISKGNLGRKQKVTILSSLPNWLSSSSTSCNTPRIRLIKNLVISRSSSSNCSRNYPNEWQSNRCTVDANFQKFNRVILWFFRIIYRQCLSASYIIGQINSWRLDPLTWRTKGEENTVKLVLISRHKFIYEMNLIPSGYETYVNQIDSQATNHKPI